MSDQKPAVSAQPDEAGAMLRAIDVSLDYGEKRVVKSATLSVGEGEVLALIGPSGAGKSSLLRCLNFLERPTDGVVEMDGHSFTPDTPNSKLGFLRREVGMVFQSFNLFPHMTASENVMLAQIHTLKVPKAQARERAMEELERVGLASHADVKPGNCSGGQQQRIAIARALALDPKVMLFDEPTSSLDPELGVEVLASMRRLASEGMTMIVVSHEINFAEEVADRMIFMADGEIIESGTPSEMLNNPKHAIVTRFVNAVQRR